MKKNLEIEDGLRPEYDFSQMNVVARGPGRSVGNRVVKLAPDVAKIFPTDESVNEALRFLMRIGQSSAVRTVEPN